VHVALRKLQTSAWSNQKTASRLCKAALLLQCHQLTASVAQLWLAQYTQLLEASSACSCEHRQLVTIRCMDASHSTTASAAAANLRSAAASGSYQQCKKGSQEYGRQWQALQTQELFALWHKPASFQRIL